MKAALSCLIGPVCKLSCVAVAGVVILDIVHEVNACQVTALRAYHVGPASLVLDAYVWPVPSVH